MSLYKRSKSGPYYMDFILFGKRINRSTGKYTLREARDVEYETRKRLKQEILNSSENRKPMLLSEAIERCYYERWCKNADGLRTYNKAKRLIALYRDCNVADVNSNYITELKSILVRRGCSNATINRYLSYLRTVLKLSLKKWHEISTMPYIEFEEEPIGRIRVVTPEEEKTLVKHFIKMGNQEMADLVIYLIDTGMRLTNALTIGYADMNFDLEMIRVWKQKGKKPYSIPMTSRVKALLERRKEIYEDRPFHLTVNQVEKDWRKVKEKMGLLEDAEFTPHALRHTCASRLVEAGVDLYVVKEWLGHSTIRVTERYAHLRPKQLIDAKELLERKR